MRMELRSTLETLQAHGFDPAYFVFLADFANAMLEHGHPREAAVSLMPGWQATPLDSFGTHLNLCGSSRGHYRRRSHFSEGRVR
jgi:hypothetical protein